MKHLITILAFSAITCSANAQTYSSAVRTQEICRADAKYSVEVFSKNTAGGFTKERAKARYEAGSLDQTTYEYINKIFKLVEEENPANAQAAYMIAWAKCMDEFSPR